MDQFHLGPPGALRALPSPSLGAGPDATAVRLGAVHRSLTGRVTVDRLAVKRSWVLSWPFLDPGTHGFLDALHLGVVAGPLWLLDPQRPNLLSTGIAATGSTDRTTTGFVASAGTLAWSTAVPAVGVPIAGGLDWTVPAAGGSLYPADQTPVPPEPVVFSAFVASAVVPVRVIAALYDTAGGYITHTESTATTPGTAGQRLWVRVDPVPNAARALVMVAASATGAGGRVSTAGWQLEPVIAPSLWTPGGGAAPVVIDALTTAYPVPGTRATTLTLLEV